MNFVLASMLFCRLNLNYAVNKTQLNTFSLCGMAIANSIT